MSTTLFATRPAAARLVCARSRTCGGFHSAHAKYPVLCCRTICRTPMPDSARLFAEMPGAFGAPTHGGFAGTGSSCQPVCAAPTGSRGKGKCRDKSRGMKKKKTLVQGLLRTDEHFLEISLLRASEFRLLGGPNRKPPRRPPIERGAADEPRP